MVFLAPPSSRRPIPPGEAARRLIPALAIGLGLVLTLPSLLPDARDPDKPLAGASAPSVPSWTRWVGACLTVGGVLGLLPTVLKKTRLAPSSTSNEIEVIEVRPIAPRRSLVLAKVAGQKILIGSSEAGLTSLGRIGGEETAWIAATEPREKRFELDDAPVGDES